MTRKFWRFLTLLVVVLQAAAMAQTTGINLEGYEYPFPVSLRVVSAGNVSIKMAVMTVAPTGKPNGRTVVLLHGKNFNGAYWGETAAALSEAGYRVIIPDQVGWGKSSKPVDYAYTFEQMIANTRNVLSELGEKKVIVVAHSMGGMMALHWAVQSPDDMESLVLINPIGLENWAKMGVPFRGFDGWYEKELQATAQSIETYQRRAYYDGKWTPKYARWANLLAAPTTSIDYPRLARVQALTSAMVRSEPIAHRFAEITVPTTLIIGDRDRTAFDFDLASEELQEKLGRYDLLGPKVASEIPGGKLIVLKGLGHLPHIEAFPRFHKALFEALARP